MRTSEGRVMCKIRRRSRAFLLLSLSLVAERFEYTIGVLLLGFCTCSPTEILVKFKLKNSNPGRVCSAQPHCHRGESG